MLRCLKTRSYSSTNIIINRYSCFCNRFDFLLLLTFLLAYLLMKAPPVDNKGYDRLFFLLPFAPFDFHRAISTQFPIHLLERLDTLQRIGEGNKAIASGTFVHFALHDASHRERRVLQSKEVWKDLRCHFAAEVPNEQSEVVLVPVWESGVKESTRKNLDMLDRPRTRHWPVVCVALLCSYFPKVQTDREHIPLQS